MGLSAAVFLGPPRSARHPGGKACDQLGPSPRDRLHHADAGIVSRRWCRAPRHRAGPSLAAPSPGGKPCWHLVRRSSPWTADVDEPRYEYSPERATAIAQDRLEPILRSRAVALGADLRLSTEMTDFTQDDDGVAVTLRPREGAGYRMPAQYVVAADGADSPIREALGIARSGQGLLSIQRSILFRAPIDHYLATRRRAVRDRTARSCSVSHHLRRRTVGADAARRRRSRPGSAACGGAPSRRSARPGGRTPHHRPLGARRAHR